MGAPATAISVTIEGACARLADEEGLRRLVAHALAAEGVAEPVGVGVVLVDDATIHELNRRYLGHDEPTDVITFPLDEDGEGDFVNPGPRALGEIYVSCERAAAQCVEWGTSPEQEIRFLVVHGVLHLLGWEDGTLEARERMLDRQRAILDAYAAPADG